MLFYLEDTYIIFSRYLEVGGTAAQSTNDRKEPTKGSFPFSKIGFGKWSFLHPGGRPNGGMDLLVGA